MDIERQRKHVKALKKEWAEAIIEYGVGSFGEERRACALRREEKKLRKMEAEMEAENEVVDQVWVVIAKVIAVLESSDIVWSRYGTESVESLAAKIVKKLKEEEE